MVATYDSEYKGGKINDSSPDGLWNVERCIAMHREYGVWERLRECREDTMRLILMEE